MKLPTTLEGFYAWSRSQPTAMAPHMERLRALADGLVLAVEFGVKRASSSVALLLGANRVISYDIVDTSHARHLQAIAGDRWDYRLEDSRKATIPDCPLLLVDSLHTYAQVKAELERHAHRVRRFLVFHDVLTFGVIGANGETGAHSWQQRPGQSVPPEHLGIRPAIDELMIRDPSWRIAASYTDSHGLLVLERR